MAGLEIRNLSKSFGRIEVLKDVSLDIRDGEFLTLVGSSGCGKSTMLRAIAGLEPQDSGSIRIAGRDVDHLRPKDRNVAMVFQSYALYPHMSVAQNISMPLIMQRLALWQRLPLLGRLSPGRRQALRDIGKEVDAVARQLHIEPLLDRKPAQLSGGQRQRVALGRAMVRHPDAFLMDEPLSNLDAKLRVHMRSELTELHRRLGVTFIYVTHDQVEAMTMSDRIALMDEGRIIQLGTPSELYTMPADLRVARFIGNPGINVLPAHYANAGLRLGQTFLPIDILAGEAQSVLVGLRPEALSLEPAAHRPVLRARLAGVENLGAEALLHFHLEGNDAAPFILRASIDIFERARAAGRLEGMAAIGVDCARAFVFAPDGRRLLSRPIGFDQAGLRVPA